MKSYILPNTWEAYVTRRFYLLIFILRPFLVDVIHEKTEVLDKAVIFRLLLSNDNSNIEQTGIWVFSSHLI